MQVILTPTAVPNLFGLGLHGFSNATPIATQLSAEWFNHVQMEVVNVIIGQDIALDSMQYDQMKKAIDDYTFGSPTISGTLTIDGGAGIDVTNTAALQLRAGSVFAIETGAVLNAADNVWVWGTTNANDWTINGNVTLGTGTGVSTVTVGKNFSDALTVLSSSDFQADVTVTSGASVTAGKFIISPSIAPTGARELVADISGNMVYRPSGNAHYVHHSLNGWTYATGEQEADSGLFATNVSLVTATRVTPQSIDVIVIAEGWGQRSAAGDVTLQLQYDDGLGVYSDQGASVNWAWVSTASATTWSYFRIARRLTPNTGINRLYRLKVDGNGGATAKIREATIRVVNPQR